MGLITLFFTSKWTIENHQLMFEIVGDNPMLPKQLGTDSHGYQMSGKGVGGLL